MDSSPYLRVEVMSYMLLSSSFPQFHITEYVRIFLPIIFRKHRLTNFRNLFVILVVTSHVLRPHRSTDLTLLLSIRILVFIKLGLPRKFFTHSEFTLKQAQILNLPSPHLITCGEQQINFSNRCCHRLKKEIQKPINMD